MQRWCRYNAGPLESATCNGGIYRYSTTYMCTMSPNHSGSYLNDGCYQYLSGSKVISVGGLAYTITCS